MDLTLCQVFSLRKFIEFEGGKYLMKASWGKTEKNQGVLSIEVDAQEVNSALDQAFKKMVQKVNVPGFRKGKVPRHIFEQRFGVESLYNDALDILLPKAYEEALKETGIEPVDRPQVDIEQIEKNKPLIFKATITVKPEVELGEYVGLEIPEKDFSVTEEDVINDLNQLLHRHAELEIVEDGEVEQGDTAVIDFEGFLNGEAFQGGKGEKYSLEIGSGSFIPGFEEQVVGIKKGEERDINVTFPEDYHSEDLAGKEVVFKIKLHEIKRKRLPELNDDFAKDVDFDTLDELKADIKAKLEDKAAHEKENYAKNTVVDMVTEVATVDIPQPMIDQEVDRMLQEYEQQLSYQGMNLELYYQFTGTNEETLKEQFVESSKTRVKTNLVLEAIAKKEAIEVNDEEIEEEIRKIAEIYKRDLEEIRNIFTSREDGLDGLRSDIQIRKTVDFLVANSK